MTPSSTDLVPFEKFELKKADPAMVEMALEANLAGQTMGMGDLDRVKIPSGGATVFEVPTLEGTDAEKFLDCVIVHHKLGRVYWEKSLDETGGGQPPDCQSPDTVYGYGDPGDKLRAEGKGCESCPWSQFGTAKRDDGTEGKGQACQERHILFAVLPGEMLPVALSLPPSSLSAIKSYMWRLSSKGRPYFSVLTRIGLETQKGNGVPDHAVATFKAMELLSADDAQVVRSLGEKLKPVFESFRAEGASAPRPPADADGDALDDIAVPEPAAGEGDPDQPPPAAGSDAGADAQEDLPL